MDVLTPKVGREANEHIAVNNMLKENVWELLVPVP